MSTPGRGLQPGTQAYIQARNSGFQAPGQRQLSSRERLNSIVEEANLETAHQMARQALEVFRQAMNSKDQKVRLDAAHRYLKNSYNPTPQLDINVNDLSAIKPEVRAHADQLTTDELLILEKLSQGLVQMRESQVIEVTEAEVVEETDDV